MLMSCLCPGKEAEMVSDDFIAVFDVTETVVFDTELTRSVGRFLSRTTDMNGRGGGSGVRMGAASENSR